MNSYQENMKFADLSEMDIENINTFQTRLKTLDDRDVVLVAYEK